MATPANSFFIGSSSFLQVTRHSTCIKTWMSSNFCQIPPLTSELSALERKKSTYYLVATLAPSYLIESFSGIEDNHKDWTEFDRT